MKKKRKELIDLELPYKVVASGFPVMRFLSEEKARESFRRFQGPGACLLISYAGAGTEFLDYKFMRD